MIYPDRYMRNIGSIGEDGQELLARKHVCVAGCGGLGGYIIEQLARIGVGKITVIDDDVFSESNLNRQTLCTEANLGSSKVDEAAKRIAQINSYVEVVPIKLKIDRDNVAELLAGCDCAIDCLDNVPSRFDFSLACVDAQVPLVFGAIAGWYGQVATVIPGDVIYSEIYGKPENGLEELTSSSLGNIAPACSVVAGFQVAECMKVLLGKGELIRNTILMIDLLYGTCERP